MLTQVLTKMCMQGFHDALRFLQSNNLIKCARYIAVESTFLISAKYEDEDDEEEHDPECQDCLRQREVSLTFFKKHLQYKIFRMPVFSSVDDELAAARDVRGKVAARPRR